MTPLTEHHKRRLAEIAQILTDSGNEPLARDLHNAIEYLTLLNNCYQTANATALAFPTYFDDWTPPPKRYFTTPYVPTQKGDM